MRGHAIPKMEPTASIWWVTSVCGAAGTAGAVLSPFTGAWMLASDRRAVGRRLMAMVQPYYVLSAAPLKLL